MARVVPDGRMMAGRTAPWPRDTPPEVLATKITTAAGRSPYDHHEHQGYSLQPSRGWESISCQNCKLRRTSVPSRLAAARVAVPMGGGSMSEVVRFGLDDGLSVLVEVDEDSVGIKRVSRGQGLSLIHISEPTRPY